MTYEMMHLVHEAHRQAAENTYMQTLHRSLGFAALDWLVDLSVECLPIVQRTDLQEFEE